MQMARGRKAGGTNNRGNQTGQGVDLNGIVNLVAQAMQTQTQLQQQLANLHNHQNGNANGGGLKNHFESLRKARAPNFEGTADPEKAKKWVGELKTNFRMLEVQEEFKAELANTDLVHLVRTNVVHIYNEDGTFTPNQQQDS